MKAESVRTTLLDAREIHTVVCEVPPLPASFSKDREHCARGPQPGAEEDDRLRRHTGGPGRMETKVQTAIHALPRAVVLRAAWSSESPSEVRKEKKMTDSQTSTQIC